MKTTLLLAASLLLGGCVAVPISETRAVYVPAVPTTYVVTEPVVYRQRVYYAPYAPSVNWHLRYSPRMRSYYWSR